MKNAINTGLFTTNASLSDVAGSCITGNCTFDDAPLLVVCSSVVNVSSNLIKNCYRTDDFIISCNYTVPALPRYPPWSADSFYISAPLGVAGPEEPFLPQMLYIGAPMPDKCKVPTLAEFYVIYTTDLSAASASLAGNSIIGVTALKNTLSLSTKTYRTSMTSGRTTTNITKSERNLDWTQKNRPPH